MQTNYEIYKKAMQKKSNTSVKELDSLLVKECGFKPIKQEGSHRIYKNDNLGIVVSVPVAHGKLIAVGTLRNILQDALPNWNVKPVESSIVEIVMPSFNLTESMLEVCKQLELNIDTLTQDDYNLILELA